MDLTNVGGFFALDILVVIIVVISGLLALARGFLRELLSLLAWIGAIFVTIYSINAVSPLFSSFIGDKKIADIVAGICIFIVSLLIFSLIAVILSSFVKGSKLGPVDRSLGFLFGLLRGGLIVCIFYFMGSVIIPAKDQPKWVVDAKTQPFLAKGAQWIHSIIPESFWKNFGEIGEEFGEALKIQQHLLTSQEKQEMLEQPKIVPLQTKNNKPGYSDKERQELNQVFEAFQMEKQVKDNE